MFSGLIASELPWATPAFPIWEGAGNDIGTFAVPKINSFVFVFFEGGDFNSPVYFAEAQTALYGLPAFKDTNYPNRKGWKTESGIEFYVDDTAKEIKVTHPEAIEFFIEMHRKWFDSLDENDFKFFEDMGDEPPTRTSIYEGETDED